jgi:ribosome-binding protein aMBF1 (putative translation factor)
MAANEKTFGGAISEARKTKGWALKDLASRVLREDDFGAAARRARVGADGEIRS